jgi:hypothetical protein
VLRMSTWYERVEARRYRDSESHLSDVKVRFTRDLSCTSSSITTSQSSRYFAIRD